MSLNLKISLIVFSLVWIGIIIYSIRHKKISVRYSLFWIFASLIIFLVGVFPQIVEFINELLGFEVISNLIVGLLITILMMITFILTIIVTKQKNQIKELIQEVSILESRK